MLAERGDLIELGDSVELDTIQDAGFTITQVEHTT